MDKAKALAGQYASKKIDANQPELTHKLCRKWKLYCPECYQFVHWRKSKSSYFAHYDVEDKSCDLRVKSSSNNAAVNINTNENQGQDLEGIQNEFEKIIFSSINSSYEEITSTISNIHCLKYISNEIKKKFIKFDANKNIKEEWEELEDWIRNNSSNNPAHCIAVLNILSIDMNRHILEKLIQYAINHVIESFELIPSRAKESIIKAQIQSNKEEFFNKTIEKTLQIIIDIDWGSGKQFKTNFKKKEYQPYVSNFNRGDGSSSLFINERYSIISCENSIYSVIDKTQKKSELFKLELNYEKGINCELLRRTSPSQDFFSQLIWKIINSSNVQWFMLAVGILASQKIQGDILTVNFIDPPSPLPLSNEKWIDSANQVIRLIGEEIEKIPVNSKPTHLGDLQAMLDVAEQKLRNLGINYEFSRDDRFFLILENKYNSVAQHQLGASAINDRNLNDLLLDIPLYIRQQIGSIIVILKASPVQNRLVDIAWCDKSVLDNERNELRFQAIGSLIIQNIKGKSVLFCKLVPKFTSLAKKHELGNGLTAFGCILLALNKWGLENNQPVSCSRTKYLKIKELKDAEKIFTNTDNKQLKEYLAKKYNLGNKNKFTPIKIWNEQIASYFNLDFVPLIIDGNHFFEVKDNREIKQISNFKDKSPEDKNIASNPESVSYPQAGVGKLAIIYDILLPVKQKVKQKKSIIEVKHHLQVERQKIKINELLDARDISVLSVNEPTKEISIYSVKLAGYVKPLLFQLAMVEQRVVLTLRNSKLPAKVDATKFQNKILDINNSLGLNSFSNVASNMLPIHYAVIHSLMLSQEFLEIRNKTSLEHDKLLTTFQPLPTELVNIYSIFAYRAVEIIRRYRNLRDAANKTKIGLQQYAQARQLDLNSYLDIVHEKMAALSQIPKKFELKDAFENLQGSGGLPKS
ncbi:hypothetical protein [Allocoleopsis franciscana]|uniref:Uncharacterized protein n=1 Tax=Allocoleopsis franciscana PCC 7113 TaxID=1173027 RepID=K9WDP6_9CYAN|nr:hypothetical protein [Allocoleopsis franciscana]AFZ17627.1 hypothetical protein Mic7113_1768 [Allocoleopsis franciscana PCC 7113]